MDYWKTIISWIIENKPDKDTLSKHKVRLCKEHGMQKIPTDIEIYMHADKKDAPLVRKYIETKPTRTGSGVAVVATMTKPFDCPHGSCTFCPGGLNSAFGNTPKSYTGHEPSTMRGMRNAFDAYRIVFNRLEQYIAIGQNPDKVDQIVMGGTFCAFHPKYQKDYIYNSFKAYNDFSRLFFKDGELDIDAFRTFFELPGPVGDSERGKKITEKILALKTQNVRSLEEEHEENENSAIRCIGLTIETKPDWGFLEHGLRCLELGATRIELGIQTVYDEVLRVTNRGHTIEDTKKSIAELRDLGFKLNFHIMPGLPGEDGKRISRERDLESIKTIFEDEAFKPDMAKIYPCMVMPGTQLEKDYREGIFNPLSAEEAGDIIVEGFKYIPEWCRVMRIQRDIPTFAIVDGVERTNLRQYVSDLAKKRGVVLRDIRAREVKQIIPQEKPKLVVREYKASGGKEYFIAMEAEDTLFGFVRLRIPPRSLHPVITEKSALIRELHVYGSAVAIGKHDGNVQHKGLGKQLMEKAEAIALAEGKNKMIVISGVGVRGYYRKIGYEFERPYMVKYLDKS
ncbi:MAG: tRNA uridine(34) 5-carboxymethylaminomethyl modification radical SAM/GNAT enzyme Elp3 [Candidatus Woesearchaeota archaeon]